MIMGIRAGNKINFLAKSEERVRFLHLEPIKNSLLTPFSSWMLLLLIGFILDFSVNPYIQLTLIFALINMILALSLNVINGYTGQFSLGHAGFAAIGAYASAYISMLIPPFEGFLSFASFLLYALVGGSLAAFAGLLVGLPSLRLKGDYLAIVTLGFGEIIRVVLLNTETLGGARGLYGISGFAASTFFGFTISPFMMGYVFIISWLLFCFFCIYRLMQSYHGRAFLSVREDEIAAEAMGIPTTRVKVKAFVLSSFFAGIAGSLFAHYANYLNPSTFSLVMSINIVIMVVLGGMGTLAGPMLAAFLLTLLPEALRPLQEITGKDLRMVIYSALLILLMLLRPEGLFGHINWNYFRKKRPETACKK